MKPDTRALKKLKRRYSKNPDDRGVALVSKLVLSYSPGWLVVWVLRKYFVKSDYKASRESIKLFQLSNRAYGAGERLKAQRLLMIALRLLGDRLPKSYISLLRSALADTLKDPTTRNSLSISILSATKKVPIEIFDASNWYQLSRGLFSLGYFRAAWVARENSLDLSISESLASDASATSLQRGIEALLERRNFFAASELISRSTQSISPDRLADFGEFIAMARGEPRRKQSREIGSDQIGESLFRDLVKDKIVALVGTGHPHGEFGDEIDSTETVVRIKYMGVESLPAPKFLGKVCHIAVHGSMRSINEFQMHGLKAKYFAGVKLILTQNELVSSFDEIPICYQSKVNPVYRTTLISGVLTLYTLLVDSPHFLKIYGFDFRSSRIQYNYGASNFYRENGVILGDPYPGFDGELVPQVVTAGDFSVHDFVSNFCFAQNLYKAGLFEIEPYGKSILELAPYQYVERLEEMLGDW